MSLLSAVQFIWNLPNTLLGIVLGLSNLSRPVIEHGAINFYLGAGIVKLVCDRLHIGAFTMGDCILYAVLPTENLRVHEGRHIYQYRILGPFFLPAYFILMGIYGYWNHPLERDARDHEMAMTGRLGHSRLAPGRER